MPFPTRIPRLLLLGLLACEPTEAPVAADEAAFERARREAVQAFDAGTDPQRAVELLLAAHALRPDSYAVNVRLGRHYAEQRQSGEALRFYEAAWQERPDDTETLLAMAYLLEAVGRLDKLVALLPELERHPLLAGEALHLRAVVLDGQGQRDAAAALLERSTGLEPELVYRAEALRGVFLLEAGDHEAALAHFQRSLAGRPDYKGALKGTADVLHRLRRDDEASRWDRILELLLDITDNVYMKNRRNAPVRREKLEELLEIYPEWMSGFQQLAELCLSMSDPAGACRTIESFLAAHGTLVNAEEAGHLRERYCP